MKRILACLAILCGLPLAATALSFEVPGDYPTIAAATAVAQSGDTVFVSPGIYFEHDVIVHGSCALIGTGDSPADVVIDAQRLGRCLYAQSGGSGRTTLAGLTLRNGYRPSSSGGGLLSAAQQLIVRDLCIEDCEARYSGGGANCITIEFQDLVLRNNRSEHSGGGLYVDWLLSGGYGHCTGLLAVGNEASDGSAVYVASALWPNFAAMDRLTVVGNRSTNGFGAVTIAGGGPEWHSWMSIDRAIFAFNEGYALGYQGEWYDWYFDYEHPGDELTGPFVSSSCFWENSPADFGGAMIELIGSYGNVFADPRFCSAPLGLYTLREDSPCLPSGNLSRATMGALDEPCDPTGVPEEGDLPASAGRVSNFPNPFNPSTQIRFVLPTAETVDLRVYDIAGRCVAKLLERAPLAAGAHAIAWDGKGHDGLLLPSGVYLYRLEAGPLKATQKMTLLK